MAGRTFTRRVGGRGNRIKPDHINELQVASEADDARIDAKADASAFNAHETDTANPHDVTKAQVGLGNVDNTSDASKPISTAAQAALDDVTADVTALDGRVAGIEGWPAAITVVFDGQGEAVEAGEVARVVMPYDATITAWRVIGSSPGTFAGTVRRATFAAFPTMTAISGSDPPALSGTQKAEDTSLSGWTTALAAGDIVELLITEATVPWVSVQIIIERSI